MPINDKTSILTYPIGSGDMRYMLENERTIFIEGDAQTGYMIRGEIPEAGAISRANLAEMLLEMALAWDAPRKHDASSQQMNVYGQRIGQALAQVIKQQTPDQNTWQQAELGMTSLLHSLNIAYRQEAGQGALHYGINHCPLCAAADTSGIKSLTETAHFALRAICQSLTQTIDPTFQFSAQEGNEAKHVLTILAA